MTSEIARYQVALSILVCMLATGCAGIQTSSYSLSDSYKINQPVKADGCYDASVLIGKKISEASEIATKVLAAVDSTVSEKTETLIKAQRNRHIGVFVGSGGEEIVIALKTAADDRTFITVATKTGFVGGAGQKAWSCQIVDQIVTLAAK